MSEPHVVVLGAGVSGLAAAHALRRDLGPGARLTVIEARHRVGGVLRTEEFGGQRFDLGAEAFLARVPEGARLCTAVGLGDDLMEPATSAASVVVRGRLRRLPARTLLGVPTAVGPVARTRVLSPRGLVRMAVEPWLPGAAPTDDVAVGALVRRRLGRQVSDRLVDPLLGGVYAGRADDLSLAATMPALMAAVPDQRSLRRAARAALDASPAAGPVFRTVRGGLGRLADSLAQRLDGADVRLGLRAALVERVGSGWRVTLAGGRAVIGDAVVVALPPQPTATVLRFAAPAAAAELDTIATASVGIVSLAYPRSALRRPPGSGFLVPSSEGRLITACTWSSAKWAHLSGDLHLVRASVGRAGETDDLGRDDDDLVAAVHADLAALLGLKSAPVESRVTRWTDALPQYAVGHVGRVARIDAAVARLAGLEVAGASYAGVGVPACIRSGEAAAARVVAHLRPAGE